MKKKMKINLVLLLSLLSFASCDNGINNFRFLNTDTLYGTKLPQKIRIDGNYFMNFHTKQYEDLDPRFKNGTFKYFNEKGLLTDFDIGFFNLGKVKPYLCAVAEDALINIEPKNHQITKDNIAKLNNAALSFGNTLPGAQSLNLQLFMPLINPKACRAITLTKRLGDWRLGKYNNKMFSFSEQITFFKFSFVLFIDYFGVAAFHYMQKNKNREKTADLGSPLRYCQGTRFSERMVAIERRPVCPSQFIEDNRIHGKGVLTVYKPNIVSVIKTVNHCTKSVTHLYSSENFWGTDSDNYPPVQQFVRPKVENCKRWVYNKTSAFGKLKKANPNAKSILQFWATQNPKIYRYPWCSDVNQYIWDAFLERSNIEVLMPSLTMTTPWYDIPKSYLFNSSYAQMASILSWDPFVKMDICLFVPRITARVESVIYLTGQNANEADMNPNSKETIFFKSKGAHAMFSVDDTMEIDRTKNYNCIPRGPNDTLYLTKDGEIIKFTNTTGEEEPFNEDEESGLIGATKINHPHESYKKMTHDGSKKALFVQNLHHDDFSELGNTNGNGISNADVTTPAKDVPEEAKTLRSMLQAGQVSINTSSSSYNKPIYKDLVSFVLFQMKEQANQNLHNRMVTQCHTEQDIWDNFNVLLEIDPSRAISSKLMRPVDARHAGNGFFVYRDCELITKEIEVVPSLVTNSTEEIFVNGVKFTVASVVRKFFRTLPSDRKCLIYPLLKFQLFSGAEMVGQLTPNNNVESSKLSFMEECVRGFKRKFLFEISNSTYVFENYRLTHTIPTYMLNNKLKRTVKHFESANNSMANVGVATSAIDNILDNIHVLSVSRHLKETKFSHIPSGVLTGQLYTLEEQQSMSMSLNDMRLARGVREFRMKDFNSNFTNNLDRSMSESSFAFSGGWLTSALGSVGDFITNLVDHGGHAISEILGAGGEAAGGVLGAVTNAGGSLLQSLIIPLGILVVVAGCTYYVYVKYRNGDLFKKERKRRKYEKRAYDEDDDEDYDSYDSSEYDDYDDSKLKT